MGENKYEDATERCRLGGGVILFLDRTLRQGA